MGQLEKRPLGKLLKKNNSLVSKVKLVDFDFKQLTSVLTIFPDNPNKTVIHQRLHEDPELHGISHPQETFDAEMVDPRLRQPINMPKNFTADWLRFRERQRSRSPYDEEEEDDEIEGQNEDGNSDSSANKRATQVPAPVNEDSAEGKSKAEVANNKMQSTSTPKVQTPIDSDAHQILERLKTEPVSKMEQLDAMGKVIAKIAEEPKPFSQNLTFVEDKSELEEKNLDSMSAEKKVVAPNIAASAFEDFVPMASKANLSHNNDATLNKLYEESKSKGYSDGFREGEQKGLLQIQTIADEVFKHLNDIVSELESLKKQILTSAQDNFYEIAQALAEALLDREFTIKPDAFAHLIQKAIKQLIHEDQFTVRISPMAYENLKKTGQLALLPSLKEDENLGNYEFKIDSSVSAVDANPKKIIANLLDQADLNLFQSDSVAKNYQSTEKAG